MTFWRVFVLNNKNEIFKFLSLVLTLQFFVSAFSALANEVLENGETKPKLERHFVFEAIPLNLEEIIAASGKIFAGYLVKSEIIDKDPESELPIVKYTFKISEGVKGIGNKDRITFKQWLPTARGEGYERGRKYVLFLYPDSSLGITSPVGLSNQGQFYVERKGFIRKKEIVRNKLNNKGLSKNLKTRKTINIANDKFINDYIHRCSEFGIPMRYREFIKAVKYFTEKES